MKVTEVVVNAGRTFNHPYEDYSNLRPSITLKATLGEEDNLDDCVKELQAKAERMVEDHKNNMLQSLRELREIELFNREVANLEDTITRAQNQLKEIRKGQLLIEEDK